MNEIAPHVQKRAHVLILGSRNMNQNIGRKFGGVKGVKEKYCMVLS